MKKLSIWFIILTSAFFSQAQQIANDEILAAISQRNLEKVSSIIQQNPLGVNLKDEYGQTPLALAVAYHNHKIAELLLKNGAVVNVGDNHLRTPIHIATFNADTVMINLLLDHGAVIDTRAIGAATPLIHASLQNNFALCRFLINKGADINIQCNALTTPLYFSVINNNLEYLDYLIKSGAEIHTPDFLGRTPLYVTVRDGNAEMVKTLILHGALEKQVENTSGQSLLHLAAIEGHSDVAEVLLQHNFQINKKDKIGFTPLDYAIKYGHVNLADFLEKNGGTANAQQSDKQLDEHTKIIKLQNGGWGIETDSSFIVLGYSEIGVESGQMSLKNGHINETIRKLKKKIYVFDSDFHGMNARFSVNGANTLLKKFNSSDSIYFIYNPQLKSVYAQFNFSNMYFPDFNESFKINGIEVTVLRSYGRNLCFIIKTDGKKVVWLTGICNNYLTYNRDANVLHNLKKENVCPDLLFLGSPAGIGPELAHGIRETFIESSILDPKNIFIMGHELLEEKVLYQLNRLKQNTGNIITAKYPGDEFSIK